MNVRPTSPEVRRAINANTDEDTRSPPASPPPIFRVHGDAMSQIGFDDSASQVGMHSRLPEIGGPDPDRPPVVRAASPDSLLLNAMRNEHSPDRSVVSHAPSERPPRDLSNFPPPTQNRYQMVDYSGHVTAPLVDSRPRVNVGGYTLEAVGRIHTVCQHAGPERHGPRAPNTVPQYSQPDYAPPRPPSPPGVSPQELRAEKEKLLAELHLKRTKGYDVPTHLDMNSSLEDLKSQTALIRRLENHKRTIALLRYFMVLACTGVEKATMRFVSEVYMDGWAETVAANQNDYDEVLGRIADTMDLASTIPPHVELVTMLAVSAVMFHMSKKSQKALQDMMQAEAKKQAPPPQPQQQQHQQRPRQPPAGPTHTQLTEEQLRIHNLITGGQSAAPSEFMFAQDRHRDHEERDEREIDRESNFSDRSMGRTRKRAKIQVDADDIVRLFD
ncbi:hypothetical protein GHT06_003833 [Daphnia sinensis]|uniref:Uncharacterized protein n=1 Tax=Daphnia sinensis TaxID=1820382 RepID=A0AAD5PKS7_9CRUS|nr:hypothetical protein GHT06_003833 [Daphnia sinensis]